MTEQEKFEDIIMQAGRPQFIVKNENGEYLNLATSAMFEVFKARQPEIDALRKELDQVKMREVVYIDLLRKAAESIGDFVSDHGWTMVDMNTLDAIDASLSATSEQVEAYRAEIIAQAKEEQRESDALAGKEWAMEYVDVDHAPISIYDVIRNNKE